MVIHAAGIADPHAAHVGLPVAHVDTVVDTVDTADMDLLAVLPVAHVPLLVAHALLSATHVALHLDVSQDVLPIHPAAHLLVPHLLAQHPSVHLNVALVVAQDAN